MADISLSRLRHLEIVFRHIIANVHYILGNDVTSNLLNSVKNLFLYDKKCLLLKLTMVSY